MYRYILIILSLALCNSCLFFGDDESAPAAFPAVHAEITVGTYQGGLYKAWVRLGGVSAPAAAIEFRTKADSLAALLNSALSVGDKKRVQAEYLFAIEEVRSKVAQSVTWNTGAGILAYHNPVIENGYIVSDTAYILWESLPRVTLDTIKTGSIVKVDSLFVDTVSVRVLQNISKSVVVSIDNVVPYIDSIAVNSRVSEVRSENYLTPITLFARAGDNQRFTLFLKDTYRTAPNYRPVFTWQGITVKNHGSIDEGVSYSFEWQVPITEIDSVVSLTITDSHGRRNYMIHVISYSEKGTVWVGDEGDLVKYTSGGTEIFRIADQFEDISSISIDPTSSNVWVADKQKGAVYGISANGIRFAADTTIKSPQAVAHNNKSNMLWVASGINNSGKVQAFQIADTQMVVLKSLSGFKGYIADLTLNSAENSVWYVNPVTDSLHMAQDSGRVKSFLPFYIFDKPVSVSYDRSKGHLWVADSNTVYLMNSDGSAVDSVTGFQGIQKISAALGICWIVDTKSSQVVKLSSTDVTTFKSVSSLIEGVNIFSTFNRPKAIVADAVNGGCWVTDTEMGNIVRLNSSGLEITRTRGLNRPSVIAINQIQ